MPDWLTGLMEAEKKQSKAISQGLPARLKDRSALLTQRLKPLCPLQGSFQPTAKQLFLEEA
jgi:hypothetical protein